MVLAAREERQPCRRERQTRFYRRQPRRGNETCVAAQNNAAPRARSVNQEHHQRGHETRSGSETAGEQRRQTRSHHGAEQRQQRQENRGGTRPLVLAAGERWELCHRRHGTQKRRTSGERAGQTRPCCKATLSVCIDATPSRPVFVFAGRPGEGRQHEKTEQANASSSGTSFTVTEQGGYRNPTAPPPAVPRAKKHRQSFETPHTQGARIRKECNRRY